jgi:hypothetical protein
VDPWAIKILSLGAIWNFSEVTGLSWIDIRLWGTKGPSIRPRCIGTVRLVPYDNQSINQYEHRVAVMQDHPVSYTYTDTYRRGK